MSTGGFYDPIIEGWIDEIEAKTLWAALFFADPRPTGDPATVEVIGGAYVRIAMPTTRLAFNTLCNTDLLLWHNLAPGVHIAAVGCFDDDTAGTLQASGLLLPDPVDLLSGGSWSLDAEQFVFGLDVTVGP